MSVELLSIPAPSQAPVDDVTIETTESTSWTLPWQKDPIDGRDRALRVTFWGWHQKQEENGRSSAGARDGSNLVPPREQGLTLIEMIVVLAIIALVAALIVPNIIGRPDQARVTVAQTDLRSISAALKMYRLDNGDYPSTSQGLAALVKKPGGEPEPRNYASGAYLDKLPVDPWGTAYIYASPGAAGSGFDLASEGKDGKPGGEGLDTDIKLSSN